MFCERCGGQVLNKVCCGCGTTKFINPKPVVLILQKVYDSENDKTYLLGLKRGIEPKKGEIAFPGGYQEIESSYDAILRELHEEIGLDYRDAVDLFEEEKRIRMATGNKSILIFMKSKMTILKDQVDFNFKTKETEEICLIDKDSKLAFPSHQEMIEWGLQ